MFKYCWISNFRISSDILIVVDFPYFGILQWCQSIILAQPMHPRHYAIRRRSFSQKREVEQKKQKHDSIIWRNEGREDLPASFPSYEEYKEYLKEMKGKDCRRFLRGFEASPSYSHDWCENLARHAEDRKSVV